MSTGELFSILMMTSLFAGQLASQSIAVCPIGVKRDDGSLITYYVDRKNQNDHTRDLLVILQGSDCNSVLHIPSIPRLKGIYPVADVLTVEKYGIDASLPYSDEVPRIDCPDEYIAQDNPELRASDLDQVISVLRDEYSYERIILIGGSEGAIVAGLLTSHTRYIDAAILFGGGGRYFLDDVIHSMKFTIGSA